MAGAAFNVARYTPAAKLSFTTSMLSFWKMNFVPGGNFPLITTSPVPPGLRHAGVTRPIWE